MFSLASIPRKRIPFIVLAIVALLLLYQLNAYRSPSIPPLAPQIPYERPPKPDNGTFHWGLRKPHYPVDDLATLPREPPRSLPRVQHGFTAKESDATRILRLQRRSQVKEVFEKCWSSYKKHAWLRDELSPVSASSQDTFGGWAATLVDALDTLWIMDLKEDFHKAVLATRQIDFTTSTSKAISIFETTIRYLGGFLGAYDLSHERILLDRAVDVGEMLLVAFDTPNHLPVNWWDWKKAANGEPQVAPSSMLVSELGTFALEFTRLTQLTGDQRFYDAVDRITTLFDTQQNKTKLPGMWPVVIDAGRADLTVGSGFTLGGMSDSLYEYFPKQFALLGGIAPVWQKLYEQSMKTASENLFFRPMTPKNDDILISGDTESNGYGEPTTEYKGQHLGCFTGGMFGLGGKLFNLDEHVAVGRKLTDGCIWAYRSMERGIMPEIAHFVPCEDEAHCPWNETRWLEGVLQQHRSTGSMELAREIVKNNNLPEGYTNIDDKRYILRPEAIESVFVLYRITGDEAYREAAWDMWTAINEVTRTEFANAAIIDITVPKSSTAPKDDRMESFWFAETLKYFYLIFSEPDLISLDEFVLNTEAHPLKRPS